MALRVSDKVSVSAVYLLAMFMAIMDIMMANVALQALGREFGVPPTQVDVVVELRTTEPLLDRRLLRDRLFCSTSAVIFLAKGAFFGDLVGSRSSAKTDSAGRPRSRGLSIVPEAIGMLLGAQVAAGSTTTWALDG